VDSAVTISTPAITPLSSIRIDKDALTPIYRQIAEAIGSLLVSGVLPPGYALPTERVLCAQFGISRMTLRQAMSLLDREGLINSRRGVGTVVTHSRLIRQQQEVRSFSEEIRARGGRPESRLISLDLAIPTPSVRDFFELHEQQKVYEVQRVRLKDCEPLALEIARLPERLCPGLERFDLAKSSLYEVLEQSYGLRPETCNEEISAETPSSQQRKLLSLKARAAVLVVNRKTYMDDGRPLELTRSVFRGDRYSAIVHSFRKNKSILQGTSS
jgi:GntR family transcriptional regulator, N-acetylglucosamine utilization regulator